MTEGKFKNIIISRTDNLGDVVLTLPLAGFLKLAFPGSRIFFIGKSYTKPIINTCIYIDEFLDREKILMNPELLAEINADVIIHVYPDKEVARLSDKLKIPLRIGTSHRFFHWLYCNKLVNFSRRNSTLHEAQLNFKLIQSLDVDTKIDLKEIGQLYGMKNIEALPANLSSLLIKEKFNIIFHPKSKGSAREWPLEKYFILAKLLPQNIYQIFITGTAAEGEKIKNEYAEIFNLENVCDLTGKLPLNYLISFINASDGLVACSTGPLHIGAALGKNVCGIYPPMRPIDPGRWAPIGEKAEFICLKKQCNLCRNTQKCFCIESIDPENIKEKIDHWYKKHKLS